jgi:hypothetical protein
MVEQQPSKLNTRVRFPSPAPIYVIDLFNIFFIHNYLATALKFACRHGVVTARLMETLRKEV